MKTKTVHTKTNSDNPVTIDYLYDYYGTNELWLKSITESINGGTDVIIEEYTYNPLGQVETKKIEGTLQTVDYTYNAKGALTGINNTTILNETDDLFAMNLTYLKNGNIQTQKYATPLWSKRGNLYLFQDFVLELCMV
jgi:YD repeat-containing protein